MKDDKNECIVLLENGEIIPNAKAKKGSEIKYTGDYGYITSDGFIFKEKTDQGYVFKSYANYRDFNKNNVCYVPELKNEEYTRSKIIDICEGNERLANFVFDVIDWQSPEAFLDELQTSYKEYPEFFDENGKIVQEDNIICKLTMEDYENVLKENFTTKQINYIKRNFTESMVKKILSNKIYIDYKECIKHAINFNLLDKYEKEENDYGI